MKNKQVAKRLLNKFDRNIFNKLVETNGYIAGGAILSSFTKNKINDYDLYFRNLDDMKLFIDKLNPIDKEFIWVDYKQRIKIRKIAEKNPVIIMKTNNAKTILFNEQIYQVITAFQEEPNDLFRYFDYTVCMGAYDPKSDQFILHEQFLPDVMAKQLHFNIGTEYPLASMLRLLKYQKKGYTISGVEVIKLGLAVHNLEIKTFADLKYHLMGIDTLFLTDLTNAFDEGIYKEKQFQFDEFISLLDDYILKYESKYFGKSDDDENM